MFITKTGLLLKAALLAVFATAIMLVSCEGPAGQAGKDGTNGKDGNETCGQCHNSSTKIVAKQQQWENSVHATGGDYARNTNQCAPCHTSDGFREVIRTDSANTAGTILNPTPQSCRTCHNVHTNYDSTDWTLTYTDPVKLRFSGTSSVTTADDFGKGNLCGKCHQSREVSPWNKEISDVATITLTSNRWGAHHSPVTNILDGVGGFDFGTITDGQSNPHKGIPNTCVTCHMATANGSASGGHTMAMMAGTTPNVSGCNSTNCHSSLANFNKSNVQTDVVTKLTTLRGLLAGKKWLDTTNSNGNFKADLIKATTSAPLTITNNQAGALFNYLLLVADGSEGVHNPNYFKKLLDKSIEVAGK